MRARSRSSRAWWTALGAGVLLVAVGTALLVSARRLPPAFTVTAPANTPSAAPVPSVSTRPAVSPVPAGSPFRPATLTMSAFEVTAPVDGVFTAAGVLAPPDDPSRVGWWGAGALAGSSSGSTVVVGHVDGPHGPGALYRLVHARAGEQVYLAGSNGERATYVISSLQYHDKGSPLPSSLFRADGPARLVIISCGGPFDGSDSEYADNVVVQATPV